MWGLVRVGLWETAASGHQRLACPFFKATLLICKQTRNKTTDEGVIFIFTMKKSVKGWRVTLLGFEARESTHNLLLAA